MKTTIQISDSLSKEARQLSKQGQEKELEVLDRARKFRRRLTRQRKGQLLDLDLTELIREMREERIDKILKGGSL
jgi:hypothetical protein